MSQHRTSLAPLALALSLGALVSSPASAATTIEGVAALREWNLIVLGDLKSSSEVEGRTFVGGNLSGNSSNYQIRTPAPSANGTPGLTVVGNVTGSHKNLNNGSGANVGGNVNSGFNLNGPAQTVNVGGKISNTNVNQNTVNSGLNNSNPAFLAGLTGQRDALIQSLSDLSLSLATLTPNASAVIASNRATFDAVPDGSGLSVFNLTAADLARFGEIQFNRNGADTVVVNVDGSWIALNDNFLGGTSNLGANVIWNFHNATSLSLTTAWGGSVLAPFASATTGNYIQGSAVFANLTQNGEVHLGAYAGNYTPPAAPPPTGAVPEPSTWAMLLLGFGALGGLLRGNRRRARLLAAA